MSEQPQNNNFNYNAYPGGQSAPPPASIPARPKQVDISFWLLIASLVLSIISVPFGIAALNSPEARATAQRQLEAQGAAVDLDAAIAAGTILVVVIAVISAVVTLLVAIFIRKGYNWARIVLTVFAVISLLNFTDLSAANLVAIVSTLLTIAATVLLYLNPAPAYFNQMKQYRLSKKFAQG
ncbi:hypothetical protein QNO08_02565 [Arthrobacter sp. zg-Y820]|uniref:hypothetical protein n=1 Tax=unclassified Arthrobacter TaxID=235627 RepID=UPI001E329B50|nr:MULTISPECIES: hypothetical protein [unclassified Arthrobacter]MCC9198466.1 hypothetical protein [Arthrobacter sp. zg-Y820]MDK1281336.1 hypothetical protein [Arthrobacter sp. zg.Y820]WIB09967.1 hypothetical protein QNO08_02565 [Arthrobacter sp. zg-Y820]